MDTSTVRHTILVMKSD